ncbi:MAG: DNA translocase FtsK, partial [Gemmatimonadota bacterium]
VASKVDSRTIIDQNGAETLLGNGDMLFLPPGEAEPARIQGAYVSSEDTDRLIDWYSKQAAARRTKLEEEEDILEVTRRREREEAELGGTTQETFEDRDQMFRQAAEVVIQYQQGSTSLLQRRLKVGYGRAARIVDQLHEAGIVGPPEGSKPREVLVTLADLDRMRSTRAN